MASQIRDLQYYIIWLNKKTLTIYNSVYQLFYIYEQANIWEIFRGWAED